VAAFEQALKVMKELSDEFRVMSSSPSSSVLKVRHFRREVLRSLFLLNSFVTIAIGVFTGVWWDE